MSVRDTFGRPLRDLRISVTDRCNFRCVYCMPKEVYGRDHRFLERRELLSFEEIARVARIFVGVRRREDPHHGRRAARAPRPRAADRATGSARRRPDADDERVAAAAEGAAARRRGPARDHGQPRLVGRRGLPRPERRRLPRPARARGDRGCCRRRATGQGERRDQARRERPPDRPARCLLPRARPHAPVHRVHGRRAHERLAARRRRPGRRDRRPPRRGFRARAGRAPPTAARWHGAGATGTAPARSA